MYGSVKVRRNIIQHIHSYVIQSTLRFHSNTFLLRTRKLIDVNSRLAITWIIVFFPINPNNLVKVLQTHLSILNRLVYFSKQFEFNQCSQQAHEIAFNQYSNKYSKLNTSTTVVIWFCNWTLTILFDFFHVHQTDMFRAFFFCYIFMPSIFLYVFMAMPTFWAGFYSFLRLSIRNASIDFQIVTTQYSKCD